MAETIVCLKAHEQYRPKEILGYGELYEQISVNRLLKKICGKYSSNVYVHLAPSQNSEHGLSIDQLVATVSQKPLETGYVDDPPWKSRKRKSPKPLRLQSIAKLALSIVAYLETAKADSAHMIYVVTEGR